VELVRAFVEALPESARAAFAETAAIAELLDLHLQAASAAWPELTIAADRFAGELARRMGEGASVARLASIKAADVFLAIACGDGDAAAITACSQILEREVGVAAARSVGGATPAQAAEVAANLRRVLFVDEPPRPAALREYSGRGDLHSYLRVMAIRDLVRAVNKGRREVSADTDDLLERIVPTHDPELSFLRAQYQDVVDEALRAAIAALDDRSRALLRYSLVERWTVDQVGSAYNVHRATAARWIAAVRTQLGERIRAELAARLEVAVDEVDSIVQLVRSRVDVSLDRVLR
jgi:RNA polymerase sigma-70 factor (ECF subfamily)